MEKHQSGTRLRDVILGGQDGLVNVLGIVLGVSAANGDHRIIIAASLAATFAEAVSMAAVAYTSTLAQKDYYDSQLKTEFKEIDEVPDEEKKEIYDIYYKKGFRGEFLDEIVKKITENKDVWAKIMMQEELNLEPTETKTLISSSLVVGLSTIFGSLIPISPFFFFGGRVALISCLFLSGGVLFLVGVYKAKTLVGSWLKSGLQMLLIGMGAAVVGFVIGLIFRV